MKNWLGQVIEVGDVVYRGARDGDSSSYKIGTVRKINEIRQTALIDWRYEYAYNHPRWIESSGSPSVNTLILMDDSVIRWGARAVIDDPGNRDVFHKHQGLSNGCYNSGRKCDTCEGYEISHKIVMS